MCFVLSLPASSARVRPSILWLHHSPLSNINNMLHNPPSPAPQPIINPKNKPSQSPGPRLLSIALTLTLTQLRLVSLASPTRLNSERFLGNPKQQRRDQLIPFFKSQRQSLYMTHYKPIPLLSSTTKPHHSSNTKNKHSK